MYRYVCHEFCASINVLAGRGCAQSCLPCNGWDQTKTKNCVICSRDFQGIATAQDNLDKDKILCHEWPVHAQVCGVVGHEWTIEKFDRTIVQPQIYLVI